MKRGEVLKNYDERIVLAFAVYSRTVDLMNVTGLSRTTICKYKKDTQLSELAKERRNELLKSAVHRLECELLKTVDALCKIRDNTKVNPQTRVSACNTILNHFNNLKMTLEISDRIEALEKRGEEDD